MLLLTEGQMSDHTGAKLLYPQMPEADTLIVDKGYDSDEFRDALEAKGIAPCIPPKRNRRRAIPFDKVLYKRRHKIENMFGRLKD
jgi:transposase